MRAVRANRELQLEKKFVHRPADITVTDAAQLAAKLAELRRPERHRACQSSVGEAGGSQVACHDAIGCIHSRAGEPPAVELTIGRGVEAFELSIDVGTVIRDRL